jgi:hypothetical protein
MDRGIVFPSSAAYDAISGVKIPIAKGMRNVGPAAEEKPYWQHEKRYETARASQVPGEYQEFAR